MLLGKLSKAAEKVYKTTPFTTEIVTAEYMSVSSNKYIIGAKDVSFELRFGKLVLDEAGKPTEFQIVIRDSAKLTSEELSTWGTDDSIVLDLIAAKLGVTITQKVETDLHHTY
jgi:hypothetical protein